MVPKVVLVTTGAPWPIRNGGQLRVAALVNELARNAEVIVAYAERARSKPLEIPRRGVEVRPLQGREAWSGHTARFVPGPWLGRRLLYPVRRPLVDLIRAGTPDCIYWTHSYLAAYSPSELKDIPAAVEFPNLERARWRSTAATVSGLRRMAHSWEFLKADRWERRVAHRASLCVALTNADATELYRDADSVIVAPNAVEQRRCRLSTQTAVILAVGSWDYRPNYDGLTSFLASSWGNVVATVPEARLYVVGRGGEKLQPHVPAELGETVQFFGEVQDLSPFYNDCALVIAPAQSGGGQQLKVTEAISYGRIVVGPPYLAVSADISDLSGTVIHASANQAAILVDLLLDPSKRNRFEMVASSWSRSHTWRQALSPVAAWIQSLQ